jgi:hypothetical protein
LNKLAIAIAKKKPTRNKVSSQFLVRKTEKQPIPKKQPETSSAMRKKKLKPLPPANSF